MQSEMNGQGHESFPGARVLTGPEGGNDRRARILVGAFSCAPAAAPSREIAVRPRDVEVVAAPELVADLHDPSLVISPGYVGPDRRRTDRQRSDRRRSDQWVPPNNGVPQWLRRVMQVVLLTTLVVVPLTMIASRSVPPAASGSSSTQVQSPGKAGATTSATGAPHVITASGKQIARAEAAYRRALARVEASGAAVAPTTSVSGADPGAAPTSERTPVILPATSVTSAQQAVTASTAAAQQHAASQAQAAQKRATDHAAAAERRAERADTRAETQAQRTAAHAGADGSTTTGVQTTGT